MKKYSLFALAALAMSLTSSAWAGGDINAGKAAVEKFGCAACHGADLNSPIDPTYPKLAGQHQDYAVAQLTNFRTGVRSNSPEMMAITHRMTDEEIKAVADYVAGLQ